MSADELEERLFATRWEVTSYGHMTIRQFYEYCRVHDLLTTLGMERNLGCRFDSVDYSHMLLPTLNTRFPVFWLGLFKGNLQVRASTKLDDDHRLAYSQVLNAFGYCGRKTRRTIRHRQLRRLWGPDGQLPEFRVDRLQPDPLDRIGVRLQRLAADHHPLSEDVIRADEVMLMLRHLWWRRKPTSDRTVTDVMLMNPITSRLLRGSWPTRDACCAQIWLEYGTDWRYQFKLTKHTPCPPPLQIVQRIP